MLLLIRWLAENLPGLFWRTFSSSCPKEKASRCSSSIPATNVLENEGVVGWILLTIKGYRVTGRNWAVYPLNVVTFRLGPKALWRFVDKIHPRRSSLIFVEKTGREFALSYRTGQPFIFWPFPLFIAGILIENKWVNIFLYRNYSWKKRCKKCGLCVKVCTSQRLYIDEKTGYPRPKGTCALCLLCINICPTNAMQMLFWSEYGNPYYPRWPEFVVKSKEKIKSKSI